MSKTAPSSAKVATASATMADVKGMPSGLSKFASLKILGANVTEVKAVTRPVLRQIDNVPCAVRILTHIYKGQEIKKKRAGGTSMAPANLCSVINMETGEEMTLIANSVLQSELDRACPNQSYVGRYFALVSVKETTKDGARSLRRYDIMEFKVDKDVGELPDLAALPPPTSDEIDEDPEEEGETAAETKTT